MSNVLYKTSDLIFMNYNVYSIQVGFNVLNFLPNKSFSCIIVVFFSVTDWILNMVLSFTILIVTIQFMGHTRITLWIDNDHGYSNENSK